MKAPNGVWHPPSEVNAHTYGAMGFFSLTRGSGLGPATWVPQRLMKGVSQMIGATELVP